MHMKSQKEIALDRVILSMADGRAKKVAAIMLNDPEIQALQEYANSVSIRRLGFNDHGPVHMLAALLGLTTMGPRSG